MEPNPEARPDIDEVLGHPKLMMIQEKLEPGIRKVLKLNHFESPIVEKLKNPLSTKYKTMNEMILISPRILKSASKQVNYNYRANADGDEHVSKFGSGGRGMKNAGSDIDDEDYH